jgi:hypothetical protein
MLNPMLPTPVVLRKRWGVLSILVSGVLKIQKFEFCFLHYSQKNLQNQVNMSQVDQGVV